MYVSIPKAKKHKSALCPNSYNQLSDTHNSQICRGILF